MKKHIYNITINIEEDIHDHWLKWMNEEHIPDMLATGKFSSAKICRVLVEEEMGGITYAVQYTTDSKETLDKYYREDAQRLRAQSKPFEGKFVAFRTELQIISEYSSPPGPLSNTSTSLSASGEGEKPSHKP